MSDVMGSKSILSDRLKGVRRSVLSARFLTNCYHDEYGEWLSDDQARYIGKIKARLDYASWALGEDVLSFVICVFSFCGVFAWVLMVFHGFFGFNMVFVL